MSKRLGKRTKKERTSTRYEYSLDYLFERFYTVKQAEGRAIGTLNKYRTNYNFFVEYLELKSIDKDIRLITTDLIRDYIVWMLHEKVRFDGHKYKTDQEKTVGLSPTTVNTRLKTLRTFFQFLQSEEIIEENPMNGVKDVEEQEGSIRILTVDELKRLLDAPNQRHYAEFRDYVLMNLLLDTFMRINEALTLRVQDVDFEGKLITIRSEVSKNRRSRVLPVQRRTAKLLKELIQETEEFDSDFMFLANYGEPLTANHFRSRLRDYAKKAGLNCKVHPHLFRHTGATMFIEKGGDLRHLQMLLGHSDLRMVLRYTHLSNRSIRRQHEQFSPMNDLIGKLNRERKVLRK